MDLVLDIVDLIKYTGIYPEQIVFFGVFILMIASWVVLDSFLFILDKYINFGIFFVIIFCKLCSQESCSLLILSQ